MRTLLELITIEMKEAFVKAGYGEELARVTLSNRPDLCEYQCNGAMAGAKKYKKSPDHDRRGRCGKSGRESVLCTGRGSEAGIY